MLEVKVFYHDVLRYTIAADWEKVQELLYDGFNVQVKDPTSSLVSGEWRSLSSYSVNGGSCNVITHYDGARYKQPAVREDVEDQTLVFY